MPKSTQKSPGATRRAWERSGAPRRAQERPRAPRNVQERPGVYGVSLNVLSRLGSILEESWSVVETVCGRLWRILGRLGSILASRVRPNRSDSGQGHPGAPR